MGDYENAGKYADSCLAITNSLIDYNDASKVDLTSTSPAFKIFNEEVIFHSESRTIYSLLDGTVDSVLFSTYANNDLRQKAFYMVGTDGKATFRGCYNGKDRYFPFNGLTTDEIYLIRAECFARAGNATQAMTMLNTLLVNRWATGTFSPYTASDPSDALKKIFDERRKELCFRPGLRWSDLRRLNLDNNYAITIKRNLDGQTFELAPNDLRYTF
ncbi:MAG: RagB/SusD family nutrient uptake outer membrane protein, partial [Bacteroidota bacterium]